VCKSQDLTFGCPLEESFFQDCRFSLLSLFIFLENDTLSSCPLPSCFPTFQVLTSTPRVVGTRAQRRRPTRSFPDLAGQFHPSRASWPPQACELPCDRAKARLEAPLSFSPSISFGSTKLHHSLSSELTAEGENHWRTRYKLPARLAAFKNLPSFSASWLPQNNVLQKVPFLKSSLIFSCFLPHCCEWQVPLVVGIANPCPALRLQSELVQCRKPSSLASREKIALQFKIKSITML
jgi:hypothetical protein